MLFLWDLLNKVYLKNKSLNVKILSRGVAWLDAGSPEQMLEASEYVRVIEKRQGLKIACLEEIAFNKNWISSSDVEDRAEYYNKTSYGEYLLRLIK